jgi:hypothetical protein
MTTATPTTPAEARENLTAAREARRRLERQLADVEDHVRSLLAGDPVDPGSFEAPAAAATDTRALAARREALRLAIVEAKTEEGGAENVLAATIAAEYAPRARELEERALAAARELLAVSAAQWQLHREVTRAGGRPAAAGDLLDVGAVQAWVKRHT